MAESKDISTDFILEAFSDEFPVRLSSFLEELRRNRFAVSPDKIMECQLVLENLAPGYEPEALKTLLCPLFARSEKEQQLFYELFERHFLVERRLRESKNLGTTSKKVKKPTQVKGNEKKKKKWYLKINWGLVVMGLIVLVIFLNYTDFLTLLIGDGYRFFIIFFGLALVTVIIDLWTRFRLRRKKKQAINRTTSGPLTFIPQISNLQQDILTKTEDMTLHRAFNRAHQEEYDTSTVDVPKTLGETIKNQGFVTLQYQKSALPPRYLFLIDRKSISQFQFAWLEHIFKVLQLGGTQVEWYYFENSPVWCWREGEEKVPLKSLFAGQRLLLIGLGDNFVDSLEGELFSWVKDLFGFWEHKALLTPRPVKKWSNKELLIGQEFFVGPASIDGLLAAIDQFEFIRELTLDDWTRLTPYEISTAADLFRLLDEKVAHWVAACAIYPRIYWSLTLYFGRILERRPAGSLVNKENLSILGNLPWFRTGKMPAKARRELIDRLPKEKERAIRKALLELLEQPANRPPEDSYAFEDYELVKLRNEYELSEEKKAKTKIRREIRKKVNTSGSDDQELVEFVNGPATDQQEKERRGVATIKERLQQKVFRQPETDQLRWVNYEGEGAFRMSSGLDDKIAGAENILLLIHGLLGDTQEIAEAVRLLVERHTYDLILTFDYRNMDTTIDQSAANLMGLLSETGFGGYFTKKINILAHSSGGLVARYLIEKLEFAEYVDQFIMIGTPNGGFQWMELYRSVSGIFKLLDFILPMNITSRLLEAFVQMEPELIQQLRRKEKSDFLQDLQPGTSLLPDYKIIGGTKGLGLSSRIIFGSRPNDGAVSIESMRDLDTAFDFQEVNCSSVEYFQKEESLEMILELLTPKVREEDVETTTVDVTPLLQEKEKLEERLQELERTVRYQGNAFRKVNLEQQEKIEEELGRIARELKEAGWEETEVENQDKVETKAEVEEEKKEQEQGQEQIKGEAEAKVEEEEEGQFAKLRQLIRDNQFQQAIMSAERWIYTLFDEEEMQPYLQQLEEAKKLFRQLQDYRAQKAVDEIQLAEDQDELRRLLNGLVHKMEDPTEFQRTAQVDPLLEVQNTYPTAVGHPEFEIVFSKILPEYLPDKVEQYYALKEGNSEQYEYLKSQLQNALKMIIDQENMEVIIGKVLPEVGESLWSQQIGTRELPALWECFVDAIQRIEGRKDSEPLRAAWNAVFSDYLGELELILQRLEFRDGNTKMG